MFATLQAVDRQRATAWFFLAFSTAYGLRILLSMPASIREQAAFYSLGVIALSVGRLMGVRNPVPCPELLLLAADRIKILCLASYKAPAADEFLLAFDRNFGYAEMWVGRLFHLVPLVGRFFETLYFGEMLAIPLLYVALPAEARKKYGAGVILVGAIIPLLYRLCPGAGPGYPTPQFPFRRAGDPPPPFPRHRCGTKHHPQRALCLGAPDVLVCQSVRGPRRADRGRMLRAGHGYRHVGHGGALRD
jgi:hypothetical protein